MDDPTAAEQWTVLLALKKSQWDRLTTLRERSEAQEWPWELRTLIGYLEENARDEYKAFEQLPPPYNWTAWAADMPEESRIAEAEEADHVFVGLDTLLGRWIT